MYIKYTHNLHSLQKSDTVATQKLINHQCNIIGKVITVLPEYQYYSRINGSGRITLRNHHFLRKVGFQTMSTPIPSALPTCTASYILVTNSNISIPASNDTHATVKHPQEALTYHHALSTHNTCPREFFNPYPGYSHIILWALKNCLPLRELCLHVGECYIAIIIINHNSTYTNSNTVKYKCRQTLLFRYERFY